MPKAMFKSRRGMKLRAPSPFESGPKMQHPDKKAIAAIERERKKRLWRQYPSPSTRLRYQAARVRLGLSPNSVGSLDWSRIGKRTTFIWKHETLAETSRWMITHAFASMHKHPHADRVQIALHYASRAFGIAISDLLDDQRAPPLVIARYIAMVIVRRSGIGRNDTARRMGKDHTVVKLAETKVAHLFEGIEYDHAKAASDLGPTSDGQPSGGIPS